MAIIIDIVLALLKLVLSIISFAFAPFASRTAARKKALRLSQYPPSIMFSLELDENDNVYERLPCFGPASQSLFYTEYNSVPPQPRAGLDTSALSIASYASCSNTQLELGHHLSFEDTIESYSLSSFLSTADLATPLACSSNEDSPIPAAATPDCRPLPLRVSDYRTASRFPFKSAPITRSLIPISLDTPLVKTRWLPYQLTQEFRTTYNTRLPEILLVDPSKPWMLPMKGIRFNHKLGQGGNGEVWSGQLQTFSMSKGWQVDCEALSGHTIAIKFEAGYLCPSDIYSGVPPKSVDVMKYEAEALLACRGASIVREGIPGETAQWYQDPKLTGQVGNEEPDLFPKLYFYKQIHPLSTVYGSTSTPGAKIRPLYVTGMELLHSSVADRIYDVDKNVIMDELEVGGIIWDLLLAVDQCHSKDMSHSDIKPDNICFGRDGRLKLIDFGHASEINPNGSLSFGGTESYNAPEVNAVGAARRAHRKGQRYDQAKADVYSIGATMLRMLSVHWDGKSQRIVRNSATLKTVLRWGYLYPETGLFLSRLMDPNPKTRYSTREAMRACQKWMNDLRRRCLTPRAPHTRFTTRRRDSRPILAPQDLGTAPGCYAFPPARQ